MKIAFDSKRFFFNNTGLGNYSRNFIYSLLQYFPENQYFLYTPRKGNIEERFTHFNNLHIKTPTSKTPFWRQFGITKDLRKEKIEIYHGLSHEIPFGLHKQDIKSVVTVHDLIFEVFPKLFKPVDRFLYQKKYKNSCLRADRIVAVSESTKNDLVKYYHLDENKISVIYQTCSSVFSKRKSKDELLTVRKKFNLPQQYILYVGSIIERKNLLDLVKAIHITPEKKRIPIVAIGNGSDYLQKVLQYVAENKLQKWFTRLSEISNSELPAIYQMAALFVYTSSYEGFGIPVIEALNSGVPVITSNVSSLPEAGGDSAYYVSPGNIEELQNAITQVLENKNLRNRMIEKGLYHAQTFSYEKMAKQSITLYQLLTK